MGLTWNSFLGFLFCFQYERDVEGLGALDKRENFPLVIG